MVGTGRKGSCALSTKALAERPLSSLHFSVDQERQHNADDTGNGEANGQAKLQGQYAQVQHKRGGQPETAAIPQPAQSGNAAQCIADKAAQHNACQHQQNQYPYIL